MNWTEAPDAKRVYDWACLNAGRVSFSGPAPEKESYYQPFDNTDNVCAYGFSSVPELEEQLAAFWKGKPVFSEVRKELAVAAFKRRPSEAKPEKEREEILRIPEFVYTF